MKLPPLLLICLLSLAVKGNAQNSFTLSGRIIDATTQEPMVAVNVFDQNTNRGTFSENDGSFSLEVSELPTTLIFSFIGYENYFLEVKDSPEEDLVIELQASILRLPDIEVIAEPQVEKLTKPTFTVKDFVIEADKILLVKYGGMTIGNVLELRDLEGHILHSRKVSMKGVVENLHQSCLGNIHLVGAREVIEVSINKDEIALISKYPRYRFDRLLKPCVEASEGHVYYRRERFRGQQVRFDFIAKESRKITGNVVVSDEDNIYRMYEELAQYAAAESYYTAANAAPDVQSGIARPEVLDAWIGLFYQPLLSPLHNTGSEICIFNHTAGFLRYYTFAGEFLRQIPINYHQERKWDKQILKDQKTGKFYTAYRDALGKKFYEIDLENGTLLPAFKINCAFVEKMVIYGDHLYYQDSGILPRDANRILHKVKVK